MWTSVSRISIENCLILANFQSIDTVRINFVLKSTDADPLFDSIFDREFMLVILWQKSSSLLQREWNYCDDWHVTNQWKEEMYGRNDAKISFLSEIKW